MPACGALSSTRHIFTFGLQLVPLWLGMDLHALGAGSTVSSVLVFSLVTMLAWFSLATVAFFHEAEDVIPVMVVIVSVYYASKTLQNTLSDLQTQYRSMLRGGLALWAVGFLVIVVALSLEAVTAPVGRFFVSTVFDLCVIALALVLGRHKEAPSSPRSLPSSRSPRPAD
jgi:O-antigen/teichoic acid export membrane protein